MSLTKVSYSMIDGLPINVRDYGAVGDGVTDDTAAMQAALNSGATSIFIPSGTYVLSSKLTYTTALTTKSFSIVGEDQVKTILKWSSASGGIEFTLPASASQLTSKVTVKNMSLVTTYADGGAAIKVNRTASAAVAPNNLFEDLYIYQEGSGYWTYGIHSIDASDSWFNRLYIMLFGSSSTACVFLDNNLTTQSVYGAYFSQCSFNGAVNCLRIRGQLESVYVTDSSFVGATDVIDADAVGTTFGNPHISVQTCHLNAKRTTIQLNKWRAVLISDTDVYSGVGVGDVAGKNINISDADHVSIVGNKFEIGAPANARSFIQLTDVDNFVISSNNMNNASAAGVIISGTSGRGVISSNTILGYVDGTKNNEGIYNVATTGFVTYTGNVIDYFDKGILFNSPNNTVLGNTFLNLNLGIDSVGGTENYAKGNTFNTVTTLYSGILRRELFASATVNPPSIAAGGRHTELVTVTGAVVGDFVDFAAPYDVTNLNITANVQNANTVGLYFYNATGGAVDLASGTWKFRVHS